MFRRVGEAALTPIHTSEAGSPLLAAQPRWLRAHPRGLPAGSALHLPRETPGHVALPHLQVMVTECPEDPTVSCPLRPEPRRVPGTALSLPGLPRHTETVQSPWRPGGVAPRASRAAGHSWEPGVAVRRLRPEGEASDAPQEVNPGRPAPESQPRPTSGQAPGARHLRWQDTQILSLCRSWVGSEDERWPGKVGCCGAVGGEVRSPQPLPWPFAWP